MEDFLLSAYRLINIYNSRSRSAHTYRCGVTLYPAQAHMLEAIGSNEGITLTEAAAMLFVTKAAVSQCVKQLCAAELVRREEKNTVGGAQELFLTAKGRSVYEEHHMRHKKLTDAVGEIWDTMSDEARESLCRMMAVTEKHILEMEE